MFYKNLHFVSQILLKIADGRLLSRSTLISKHFDVSVKGRLIKAEGISSEVKDELTGITCGCPKRLQHLRQLVRNAQKELAAKQLQPVVEPSSDAKEGLPASPVQRKPQTKAQSALRRYLQDVAVRIEETD